MIDFLFAIPIIFIIGIITASGYKYYKDEKRKNK
tara:strand:- start:692 stop:793 length:102 start_codon:yes stop_codon:yes gene_type:complete